MRLLTCLLGVIGVVCFGGLPGFAVTAEEAAQAVIRFNGGVDPGLISPVTAVEEGYIFTKPEECWVFRITSSSNRPAYSEYWQEMYVSKTSGAVIRAQALDHSEVYCSNVVLLPESLDVTQAVKVAERFVANHYPDFARLSWKHETCPGCAPGTITSSWIELLPNSAISIRQVSVSISLATGQYVDYHAVIRPNLPPAASAIPALGSQKAIQRARKEYPSADKAEVYALLYWSEKDERLIWAVVFSEPEEPLPVGVPGACLLDAETGVILGTLLPIPGVSGDTPIRPTRSLPVAGLLVAGLLLVAALALRRWKHATGKAS